MKPFRLEPVYKQTVWADDYLTKTRNLEMDKVGIAREVCAYKGSENKIKTGEFSGQLISDVILNNHDLIMGDDSQDQLVRVAYMSSLEDLSIQVHMNEEQASKVNDYEKSEAWYILRANTNAFVYAGINTDDKEVIKQAIENNELEKYLIKVPVKEGDFVKIPANLVHANGKGMLVLEVGSFGGITYRLYDFGRGRQLDIEKGLEVANLKLKSELTHHPLNNNETTIQTGVHHELFHTDIIDVKDKIVIDHLNRYEIYTCVNNYAKIICDGQEYILQYTETLFVPASSGKVTIMGDCRVLRTYRP